MRITAQRGNIDYWGKHFRVAPIIKVDGNEFKHVVMADDETGTVQYYMTDDKGHFITKECRCVVGVLTNRKVEIIGERTDHAR